MVREILGLGAPLVLLLYLFSSTGCAYFNLDYGYVNITVTTPGPTVWYYNSTVCPSGTVDGFMVDMSASGFGNPGNEVIFWADATPSEGGDFTAPDTRGIFKGASNNGSVKKYITTNFGFWYIYYLLPDGSVTLKSTSNETAYEMLNLVDFEWRDEALGNIADETDFVVLPTYAS